MPLVGEHDDLAVGRPECLAFRAHQPGIAGRTGGRLRNRPQQLRRFLTAAICLRLYPALHLAAHTGMRRGEVAGLNWGDLDVCASSLSIVRSRQATMGRTVEGPVKTRTSRRRIDLDAGTVELLVQWRHRLVREGATIEPSTPMFLNTRHRTPSPESFSQLFGQIIATTDLPRIRFHDLRHTHGFTVRNGGRSARTRRTPTEQPGRMDSGCGGQVGDLHCGEGGVEYGAGADRE